MNNYLEQSMVAEVRHCTAPVREDFHYHLEYELIYIVDGLVEIEINKKLYRVSNDTLVFITSLDNHSVHQLSGRYERYYITLNTSITDAFIHSPFLLNMLKNHTKDFQHCVDVSPIRDTVQEIFNKLLNCCRNDMLNNELVGCYISELLIHVCRLQPQWFKYETSAWKSRILNIQTYLDIHYREKIKISDICQEFYISSSCLTHQFSELTGYSPKQYLTMIRLKEAAIEIHNSEDSISEIVMRCGFSDLNNFMKQFKRFYGCTPSQFRPNNISTGDDAP